MNESPKFLSAAGVYKSYPNGKVKALVNATLSVARGEYACIMGPSGSGKSTLLNLLGGLDVPDRGEIYFEDASLSTLPSIDQFRATKVGYIFQSFLLLPTLNAMENVQIPMFESKLHSRARASKARELLVEVGLEHRVHHVPQELSVGERQRVAIARALANDPPLLLADEPTGNLDSHSAEEVLDLFDRLRRERSLTLVVVTHSDALARRSDRTIQIRDGQIQ